MSHVAVAGFVTVAAEPGWRVTIRAMTSRMVWSFGKAIMVTSRCYRVMCTVNLFTLNFMMFFLRSMGEEL
jgi:hypothetical protein